MSCSVCTAFKTGGDRVKCNLGRSFSRKTPSQIALYPVPNICLVICNV